MQSRIVLLATSCYARRGLYHRFDVIDLVSYIFIYLFSSLTFFFKTLLLLKLLTDFDEICICYFRGPWGFKNC